jgi:hypothetical protein
MARQLSWIRKFWGLRSVNSAPVSAIVWATLMSFDAIDEEKAKRIQRVVREIDRALASTPGQASAFVESFPTELLDHLEAMLVRVKTMRIAQKFRRVSSRHAKTE